MNGSHVTHLLAAYTEGQLSPRRSAAVRAHLASCPACRSRLAAHERLAADLRLALRYGPALRSEQIAAWWAAITARRIAPARPHALALLAPLALTLVLLAVPFAISGAGPGWPHAPGGTIASLSIDATLAPPAIVYQSTPARAAASDLTGTAQTPGLAQPPAATQPPAPAGP